MNHAHRCRVHGHCIVIVNLDLGIKTHIGGVQNIDKSCPYHGLHLMESTTDTCFKENKDEQGKPRETT
jgi:hypothetical protein